MMVKSDKGKMAKAIYLNIASPSNNLSMESAVMNSMKPDRKYASNVRSFARCVRSAAK
jgi:hypothetical protein